VPHGPASQIALVADRLMTHPDPRVAQAAAAVRRPPPGPISPQVRVRLLGPVAVSDDGSTWRHVGRERVRALLTLLLFEGPLTREQVTTALWPNMDDRAAAGNLRVTLTYLRNLLDPDRLRDGDEALVQRAGGRLWLRRDGLHLDVDEFDRAVADLDDAERQRAGLSMLDACRRALDMGREALAADVEGWWVEAPREHVRRTFVHVACRAAELELARGEPESARGAALAALQVEPASERAGVALARAKLGTGDVDGARATLADTDAALADLGIAPSEASRDIRRRLRMDQGA
jgi:DNA-binding SARP family transcriptional activator